MLYIIKTKAMGLNEFFKFYIVLIRPYVKWKNDITVLWYYKGRDPTDLNRLSEIVGKK